MKPLAALLILILPGLSAQAPKPVQTGLTELFTLCEKGVPLDQRTEFETLGIVRRTKALDEKGLFAIVHPIGSCCPRGIAIGLLARAPSGSRVEEGDAVTVCGVLRPLAEAPPLPKHPVRRLQLGILRRHVVLQCSALKRYDRLGDASRPTVAESLDPERHASFLRALRLTGWESRLREPCYFTVLAPTEMAFGQLTPEERTRLFAPDNREELRRLVERHLLPRAYSKRELMKLQQVASLLVPLPIRVVNGKLQIGDARVLFTDASPRNGSVLSLDRVLSRPSGSGN